AELFDDIGAAGLDEELVAGPEAAEEAEEADKEA
ncbi:MAG: 50S ribosomal protein L9, partial [Alphaproteobacteria bacterium]